MAETTHIEWADRTFSPWEGCQKVGPGCTNCYAEARNNRFHGGNWGPGAPRRMMSESYWRNPIRWNRDLGAQGRRETVFPSLCDPFDNAAPEGGRVRFGALIEATPNLEWLLLTKRIGNAVDCLMEMFPNGAPGNVRVGATIVNQEEWNRDFPKMPAVRVATGRTLFLSCEPLLGSIEMDGGRLRVAGTIGWVIVGGESGPGARPMHPDWAESLRDQCDSKGIPFLFKQWGEWAPLDHVTLTAERTPAASLMLDGTRVVHGKGPPIAELARVGKKAAGRLLYGVQHDGFPA